MIERTRGNLLEANVEALVNPVNCVGVMDRGLALQLKRAFPEYFRCYEQAYCAKEVQPGRMLTAPTGRPVNPEYIINFPTKRHTPAQTIMREVGAACYRKAPTMSLQRCYLSRSGVSARLNRSRDRRHGAHECRAR